jgi:hypothetical protein
MFVPAPPTRRGMFLALAVAYSVAGCATIAGPSRERDNDTAAMAAAAVSAAEAAAEANQGPANAASAAHTGQNVRSTPPAVVAAAAAAAAQAAQGAKPFADVVKEAQEMPGLFRLWRKDDRVWIEIEPRHFESPFFLTSSLNQGIGEHRLFGGMMTYPVGFSQLVQFRKVGTTIQLIAKNVKYTAQAGTPEALAVASGFSDSLLATAAVASQPHPERKSILVEANALFVSDLAGGASALERTYRQPYAFDARNSALVKTRSDAAQATFEVTSHYALSRPVQPPPGFNGPNAPALPGTVPDVRSLFLGFHYTLAKLPDEPMRPRLADDRIGYFTTERLDYTSDVARVPVVRYVNRWRLEKKDPAAAMSEPKEPIVFWLDRNIPVKYRPAIRDGILEWNKAFERIGFIDAIRVEVQPDDADFDTSDLQHASVRWLTVAKTSFGAIGPTIVDPRTGEILDADIGIDANNVRVVRNLRAEYVPKTASAAPAAAPETSARLYCTYDDMATGEAVFGLSLLEARGELDADGPEVDRFVAGFLKDTTMHEVGHTLGLRHNFRASTIYTAAELADADFTRRNGISGSVMEYNPWNIALKGAAQGEYQMSTLGPYDYWAIEYGYKEVPADQEASELLRIAGRSSEPLLAYATDEDASFFALDPQINQLDLGTDPLAYAQKRFALVHELWQRTESREMKAGESYSILRRNFSRGLSEASQGAVYAAKYIGGLTTLRDRAGTGRDPLNPVSLEKQREALRMLATEVFSAESFKFSPGFLRRMAVSTFDMEDAAEIGRPVPTPDIALDQQVLSMQRSVLAQLMSETVAQRLLNNEAKLDDPAQALRLSELYGTLHTAIWSELKNGADIPLFRRNLQREHAARVASAILRPAGTLPADARALLRADARALRDELANAQYRKGFSAEARAHVAETLATLDEALRAPIIRQAL